MSLTRWLRGQAASLESFSHALKTESDHHRVYATHDQARRDLFQYIEGFHNPPSPPLSPWPSQPRRDGTQSGL